MSSTKIVLSGLAAFSAISVSNPLQNSESKFIDPTLFRQNPAYTIPPPNIIYILADDLGYGDLSCYGQKRFQTPNLDKLASRGMLFTQHYAGCTVSAPSRSSLMTGLTTGYTPIRGNKEWKEEGQIPLPSSSITIAEVLHAAGYVTGAFGKWGLGYPGSEGDPNNQGFDEFYGFNCQRLAHNYYPDHLWSNQEKVILPGNSGDKSEEYAPDLIQKQVLRFIEKNKSRPFFLYYPSNIPHAELAVPEENLKAYRGKFQPEKVFNGAIPGGKGFRTGAYATQTESHAAFAALVVLLDQYVGEVMAKLKELGLEKNTIILFSSDNGPHQEGGGDPDFFDSNGPLKGYKRDLYEGGIREPMLVSWPGKIAAGSKTDLISAFWDVMPTLAEVAGVKRPKEIDGISFLPTLLGKSGQKAHESLYWEFHELGGRQAVRMGEWKLVRYNVLLPEKVTTELYNLQSDVGETINVAEKYPEVVKKMKQVLQRSRKSSEVFIFNPTED